MNDPILDQFPKIRKDLPPQFQAIYETHYKKNRQGETKATSLSMRMERWLHSRVASDVKDGSNPGLETLEIGAGMLNQLAYEPGVKTYDIVEPFEELYRGSPQLGRIRKIFADIVEIPGEKQYDRITSIAAFEHILNLPDVVAKAAILLRENGSLRVSIPNEGTILWKFGTLITGYEFKKLYGLDYQVLMRYEHVNTADEIEEVLKCFFHSVSASVFGVHKKLAFYRFLECTGPDYEKAGRYLDRSV